MAGTWLALGAVLAVIIQGSSDDSRSAGITWGTYDTIRSANVDGSAQHVLVPPIADNQGDPAWTRDGHMLALFGRNSDSSWIFAFSPQSHKLRRLGPRSAARGYEPTWSPDAKRVAFAEDWGPYYGEPREATIKILSLATNKRTLVTRPQYNRIDSEPAWSPDAQTIVFVRQRLYGTQTIYLTHPDGSETRALTMGSSPSWSPDSKSLAFALGNSIYRIRADGSARMRIVSGLVEPLVRWSPDGRKVLYKTGDGANADLWVADVDGTHRRRVVHHQSVEGIAWRPAFR